ncbi:uncharacterized protein LACBIDRAFT_324609 [Laccaria bicolor S238N-H82]|uniref:Predicted protein n=1 Tax=Laccaria bicolor (strain S238N-H82 / ATCC MYA-4686) TaxID=486041 RepID=B0D2G3_LACBS|nr:uncharacterized protein LACBIDRAFT_324609 [Laccaria bicolor S238N-H82]EDR10742.1 predicted protein [Laccaria bicolor S238N-H82]|eukprot:XP_001878043.1 predicted protein [Laccaria bicolor S238N-H82]
MANNNEGTRKTGRKTNNSQSAGMAGGTSTTPGITSSTSQVVPPTNTLPEAENDEARPISESAPSGGQHVESFEGPADQEEDDIRSDYSLGLVEFGELTELGGPYRASDLPSDRSAYSEITIEFPSCKAFSSYGDMEKGLKKSEKVFSTAGRHLQALKFGETSLRRSISNYPGKNMSRNRKKVFTEELGILNELLTNLYCFKDEERIGFALQRIILVSLNQRLRLRREQAEEDLIMAGYGIPSIPRWGLTGKADEFWNANDFEILGACYRREVENFLTYLSDHHEFPDTRRAETSSKPRTTPLGSPAVSLGERSPVLSASPVLAAPVFAPGEADSILRFQRPSTLSYTFRTPRNVNSSVFGHPTQNTASKAFQELLGFKESKRGGQTRQVTVRSPSPTTPVRQTKGSHSGGAPGPGDSDGDDSNDEGENRPSRNPRIPQQPHRNPFERQPPPGESTSVTQKTPTEPQFDVKLKMEAIPTWDGSPDSLRRWFLKLNSLAKRSDIVFKQLDSGNGRELPIKFHEDSLVKSGNKPLPPVRNSYYNKDTQPKSPFNPFRTQRANVNLVGWTRNTSKPQFPKDDSNVSPRGTPEEKGARPCRHCGSPKHWDRDCKYARKGERFARVNSVTLQEDEKEAQDRRKFGPSGQVGFSRTLSVKDPSSLGGEYHTSKIYHVGADWKTNLKNPYSTAPCLSSDFIIRRRPPEINRKTRRKLAREIQMTTLATQVQESNGDLIELRKHLARPPGCAFLGAKVTEAYASLNGLDTRPIPVIIDSGSDITLISQKTLDQMLKAPKIRVGQQIKLIQVTGKAIITGYVILDLIFKTPKGPVQINVEAYVVKGMSAEFILGNDFADQYSISVLREEGETTLKFGSSGRSVKVHNSLSTPFLDEDGHAFKKKRTRHRQAERQVRSRHQVTIPPEASKLVHVDAGLNDSTSTIFVERSFLSNGNAEELYGIADTLVDRDDSRVFVSNFSKNPITIPAGQVLGTAKNPSSWLDKKDCYSSTQKQDAERRVHLIQTLLQNQTTTFKVTTPTNTSMHTGRSQGVQLTTWSGCGLMHSLL